MNDIFEAYVCVKWLVRIQRVMFRNMHVDLIWLRNVFSLGYFD